MVEKYIAIRVGTAADGKRTPQYQVGVLDDETGTYAIATLASSHNTTNWPVGLDSVRKKIKELRSCVIEVRTPINSCLTRVDLRAKFGEPVATIEDERSVTLRFKVERAKLETYRQWVKRQHRLVATLV